MTMPPAKPRRPRTNPLIPTTDSVNVPPIEQIAPQPIEAPICTQHWPDGWVSLPEGADFASCEHGEWSTNGHTTAQARVELERMTAVLAPLADNTQPYVIDGVTTDGTPVKVTIRPGEPALVTTPIFDLNQPATHVAPAHEPQTAPVSPFRPQPAPSSIELDGSELDTGEDVMFMPSGG